MNCSSDGCESPVRYEVDFGDGEWHPACLFHAAVCESLGGKYRKLTVSGHE